MGVPEAGARETKVMSVKVGHDRLFIAEVVLRQHRNSGQVPKSSVDSTKFRDEK